MMPLQSTRSGKSVSVCCVESNRIFSVLVPLPPLNQLAEMWRSLESQADGSFFTSWSWIGAWLATCFDADAKKRSLKLLVGRCDGKVIALAVVSFGRRSDRKTRLECRLFLNQSNGPGDDALFIEYNDFLVAREAPRHVRKALLEFLVCGDPRSASDQGRSGFSIAGAGHHLAEAVYNSGLRYRVVRQRTCPWVALSPLSTGLDGYLTILSANTRQKIRRSVRLMAREGPLTLTAALTLKEAYGFLMEMKVLHQSVWKKRTGRPGAFASVAFEPFIKTMIEIGFGNRSVNMLRVAAGGVTVGVLCNLVHNGHVFTYQSGFAYRSDNRIKPGLVSHALAIAYYRDMNFLAYHFMAGDGQYKTSMSSHTETLIWLEVRRNSFWSWSLHTLYAAKARLSPLTKKISLWPKYSAGVSKLR